MKTKEHIAHHEKMLAVARRINRPSLISYHEARLAYWMMLARHQDNEALLMTLKIACLLLDLEARAHEENEQWLPERRKRIAATLRSFTAQVRHKLENE